MPVAEPLNKRRVKRDGLFLPKAVLSIVLALPLGVVTGIAGAVPVFGSIVPVSVLLAFICPIIVPVVAITGVLFGSWLLACAIARILIRIATSVIALARLLWNDTRIARPLHILFHAHEIAYMGIYGAIICFSMKPDCETKRSSVARLFISNMPPYKMPTFPASTYSPCHTPVRSPSFTESTDSSPALRTPTDDPAESSFVWLSEELGMLRDHELDLVASYVDRIKKGRTLRRNASDGCFDL